MAQHSNSNRTGLSRANGHPTPSSRKNAGGTVILEDLLVRAFVGVTERERSKKQRLLICVEIEREPLPGSIGDSIENTIDYSEVRRAILDLLERTRFNLIETIAERIAILASQSYQSKGARRIQVMVKKFPYRDARCAAYRFELRA